MKNKVMVSHRLVPLLPSVSACLFAVVIPVTGAAAADFPARRLGLWELNVTTGTDQKSPTWTMRQCTGTDVATDQALQITGTGKQGACSKRDVHKSGATITIDSVCTSLAEGSVTSHMVITGNFQTDYAMTITSQRAGGGSVVKVSGVYQGPCAPGQRAGDMTMTAKNGTKFDVHNDGPKDTGPPVRGIQVR
jgi:hypothetical protein